MGLVGNPSYPYGDPIPPIPITADQHFVMGPGGTLQMVFEADAWDSTISFAPGIPVTLGGTLELSFAGPASIPPAPSPSPALTPGTCRTSTPPAKSPSPPSPSLRRSFLPLQDSSAPR
jgi:hypothetical protein